MDQEVTKTIKKIIEKKNFFTKNILFLWVVDISAKNHYLLKKFQIPYPYGIFMINTHIMRAQKKIQNSIL